MRDDDGRSGISEGGSYEAFFPQHDDILYCDPLLMSPYSLHGLGNRTAEHDVWFEHQNIFSSTRYLTSFFLEPGGLVKGMKRVRERSQGREAQKLLVALLLCVCDGWNDWACGGNEILALVWSASKRLHGVMRIWEALMGGDALAHEHVHQHVGHGAGRGRRG